MGEPAALSFASENGAVATAKRLVVNLMLALEEPRLLQKRNTKQTTTAFVWEALLHVFDAVQLFAAATFLHLGTHAVLWGSAFEWLGNVFLPVALLKEASASYTALFVPAIAF